MNGVTANYAAVYNPYAPVKWSALVTPGMGPGISSSSLVVAAGSNGDLLFGGSFQQPGAYITRYTPPVVDGWNAFAGGVSGLVYDMAWIGSKLIVAGSFSSGGSPAFTVNNIGLFDPATSLWEDMGTTTVGISNGVVFSVKVLEGSSTKLVAAGACVTQAEGLILLI